MNSTEKEYCNLPTKMTEDEFVATFGGVYEHSPWIARTAWQQGLNASHNTPSGLSSIMMEVVAEADHSKLLDLINAHPDLAGKAAIDGELTEESSSEQSGAGIDQCTTEEFEKFQYFNNAYKEKFNFPFIMAVKGSNRHQILEAFDIRIENDEETEFKQAITEINKIARFRLDALAVESITIYAEPLTKEAFAPYGDVIEIDGARHFGMNDDGLERYYDLANIDVDHETGGRVVLSITTCNKQDSMPFTMTCIERHPRGSQAFIPMNSSSPLIIAVTEPSDTVDLSKIKAFVSNGKQGFNYKKNVWHMPAICLDAEQQFMIIDRGGEGDNCDLVQIIDKAITISLKP